LRKIMSFKLASRDAHLPKLVGAFIVFAALLLFLRAAANMYDSWDAVQSYPSCIKKIGSEVDEVAQLQYMHCKDALYKITGVQLRGDQDRLSRSQFWAALLGPIAEFLWWAVVFILGIIFYRTGNIVVPIEQVVREMREEQRKK